MLLCIPKATGDSLMTCPEVASMLSISSGKKWKNKPLAKGTRRENYQSNKNNRENTMDQDFSLEGRFGQCQLELCIWHMADNQTILKSLLFKVTCQKSPNFRILFSQPILKESRSTIINVNFISVHSQGATCAIEKSQRCTIHFNQTTRPLQINPVTMSTLNGR